MKKILSLMGILLVTFLCIGCGAIIGNNDPIETEPPEIELTLENYTEYLEIKSYTTNVETKQNPIIGYTKVGESYFRIYSKVPGKYKNVNLDLKLTSASFRDYSSAECIYDNVVLPTNGEYSSSTYRTSSALEVSVHNVRSPYLSVKVESISGAFIPD